jgi:hypothetical protein
VTSQLSLFTETPEANLFADSVRESIESVGGFHCGCGEFCDVVGAWDGVKSCAPCRGTPEITGVSHEVQWPTWRNTLTPRGSILDRAPFPGWFWVSDTFAAPDSDYTRRFGLAWCCVVVAAVLMLRRGAA